MSAGKYWLCWSPTQGASHIEAEEDGLRINLRAFMQNRRLDYIPIAIFQSREEAMAFIRARRELFERRFNNPHQGEGSHE